MVLRKPKEEEVDAATAASTASAAGSLLSSPSRIISIPLQSYETIQRRRRRRRQRQKRRRPQERRPDEEEEEEDGEEEAFGGGVLTRRTRKSRRRRRRRRNTPIERPTFSRHDPRFLQLPTAAVAVAGLYQGYGTNYVDLWCGTPQRQRQTVIVDTGSGATAFPCAPECNDKCGVPKYHLDDLYDPSRSATFRTLTCHECTIGHCLFFWDKTCQITRRYAEGSSWRAVEVADQCHVGDYHESSSYHEDTSSSTTTHIDPIDPATAVSATSMELTFACQSKLTGLFVQQLADGIMGMNYSPTSYWWQSYNAGKINKRAFALCLGRNDIQSDVPVGILSLGGVEPRLHHDADQMVYAILTPSTVTTLFQVQIRALYLQMTTTTMMRTNDGVVTSSSPPPVKIGGVDIMNKVVIVDSGTTDSYFSASLAQAFHETYRTVTGRAYDNKNIVQYADLDDLRAHEPTILLQLVGDVNANDAVYAATNRTMMSNLALDLDPDHAFDMILAVPPEHYFEHIISNSDDEDSNNDHANDGQQQYQSRFFLDERGPYSIIGANMLMGHDVLFDIDHRRLGIVESSCNYTALTAAYPAPPSTLPERDWSSSYQDDDNDGALGGMMTMMGLCTTHTCQYGSLAVVTIFVLCFVRRVMRGRRSYERVAGAEEEDHHHHHHPDHHHEEEEDGLEMRVERDRTPLGGDGYRDDVSYLHDTGDSDDDRNHVIELN